MGRVVRGTVINYGGHLPAVGHVDPTPPIPCGMGACGASWAGGLRPCGVQGPALLSEDLKVPTFTWRGSPKAAVLGSATLAASIPSPPHPSPVFFGVRGAYQAVMRY